MRRAARGRLVPQSRSTDPRLGRVSLKAATLYDRMWINADDQGRLSGDPDEIKYTSCPNLPDISKEDIPTLLGELAAQRLILVYSTTEKAIQMLDWWHEHKLQWAYPSDFSAPDGWSDHLRYHPTPTEIVTENWPPPVLPSKLPSLPASPLPSPLPSKQKESNKENPEKDKEKEEGEGEGRLPSRLGSKSSPSLVLSTDINKIINKLVESFRFEFGRVPAESPGTVLPREPTPRERAQIRDLAEELSAAGGCPLNYIREAFREAAGQQPKSKRSISYVRAVLLDWLGVQR